MEVELVARPAIEVDEPRSAQRICVTLDHAERIVLEPAPPHVLAERSALEIAREIDPERRGVRIRRVGRGHRQDVQRRQVLVLLLELGRERLKPGLEPPGLLDLGAEPGNVTAVAVLEVDVAAVRGHGAEHLRVAHGERQRAVAAGRLAHHAAVLASRQRAVGAVHVRDQLCDHVVLVAPGGARVEVLGAAVAREAVGQDEDHLLACAARDQRVHALVQSRRPRIVVEERAPAPGETREHERHRIAPLAVRAVGRRKVDRHGADVRITQAVAGEDRALELLQDHMAAFDGGQTSRSG